VSGWLEVGIGVLAGGLVTVMVSRAYYLEAAKDLARETAKLRKLISVTIAGMEQAGFIRAARNEAGELTGLITTGKDVEVRYNIHGPDSAE